MHDEEEGCEVEELDPVVDDHALDFQVNLRPEEGKDGIFDGPPLFQSSLVDEEYVSFLENEVQNDDEREETEKEEMVRSEDDVEHGFVGSEARTHNAISKHLVPDELLKEIESLFFRLNLVSG